MLLLVFFGCEMDQLGKTRMRLAFVHIATPSVHDAQKNSKKKMANNNNNNNNHRSISSSSSSSSSSLDIVIVLTKTFSVLDRTESITRRITKQKEKRFDATTTTTIQKTQQQQRPCPRQQQQRRRWNIFLDINEIYTRRILINAFRKRLNDNKNDNDDDDNDDFCVTLGPGSGMEAISLPPCSFVSGKEEDSAADSAADETKHSCSSSSPSSLSSSSSSSSSSFLSWFQWAEYERIDWEAVLCGQHGASSYCVRKGLSRKAQLAYYTHRYICKYPTSILKNTLPQTIIIDTWPVWDCSSSYSSNSQDGLANVVIMASYTATTTTTTSHGGGGRGRPGGRLNQREILETCLESACQVMKQAEQDYQRAVTAAATTVRQRNGVVIDDDGDDDKKKNNNNNGTAPSTVQTPTPPLWILKGSTVNKGAGIYLIHVYEQLVDILWSEDSIREWYERAEREKKGKWGDDDDTQQNTHTLEFFSLTNLCVCFFFLCLSLSFFSPLQLLTLHQFTQICKTQIYIYTRIYIYVYLYIYISIHFRVLQRYIDPPLLLGGRKFHIRAYVLAVGALQVYMCRECLALCAGSPYYYDNDDNENNNNNDNHKEENRNKTTAHHNPNLWAHVTNTSYQALDPHFQSNKCILSWTVDDIVPLLSSSLSCSNLIDHVLEQMQNIIGELFRAYGNEFGVFSPLPDCFEHYGFDFIVSHCEYGRTTTKVYLLEVNPGPDFTQTGIHLSGIVERFLSATIDIVFGGGKSKTTTTTTNGSDSDSNSCTSSDKGKREEPVPCLPSNMVLVYDGANEPGGKSSSNGGRRGGGGGGGRDSIHMSLTSSSSSSTGM